MEGQGASMMKQETFAKFKTAGFHVPTELADHIPGYMSRREEDMNAMWTHFHKGEFEAIGRIAHKIKGNGASYGFESLTQLAERLQNSVNSKDRGAIEADVQALDQEVKKIRSLMG